MWHQTCSNGGMGKGREMLKNAGMMLREWALRQLRVALAFDVEKALGVKLAPAAVPVQVVAAGLDETTMIAALVGPMAPAAPRKAKARKAAAPAIGERAALHHAAGHRDARRVIARAAHAEFHKGIREGLKARGR